MDLTPHGVTVHGHAKINLHLDITGRLAGGYHRVETVMQSVSLCDTVTVRLHEEARFFAICDQDGVPTDDGNIAVRAARRYAEAVESTMGAQITIQKKIPMAAGLAGGSADAAATLVAMNRLYGEPLSVEALCQLGGELGADVPFCIVGGTKYADGKGEILHEFPTMPDCVLVIACGGEGVSTPWGYRLLDERYGGFLPESCYVPRSVVSLRTALNRGDLSALCGTLYNIFEEPVLQQRPVAADLRATMLSCGALGAMMSGSGPSVFGIFASEADGQKAVEEIQGKGFFATRCHPHFPGNAHQ